MSARHREPHTVMQQKRVYTDARGNFYDVTLSTAPCACDHDADHGEVVARIPFEAETDD